MTHRPGSTSFIYITVALDALAFGVVVPVVPARVMRVGHVAAPAASFWVGVLLAAFAAMQFLASPVLGGLSDRFGRRPVLLLSLAALGVSLCLTAYAPGLIWLIVVRMFAGATSGNSAAAEAYIADVTDAGARAGGFGKIGALYGFGFVVGPALGGLLGDVNVRLPFLAAAALAFGNVVYGALALPESLPAERRRAFDWRRANPFGSIGVVFRSGVTARLGVAWCCLWFALGAQQSSFILANEMRFRWNNLQNGLVLALAGAASALTQGLLVPAATRRVGLRGTALLGVGFCALGYGCYAFAASRWIMFPGMLILALGALGNPAIQSMVSAQADETSQGEVQGGLASLQGLMAIVSPPVTGWLFARCTRPQGWVHFPGAPFLLAAVVCGAGLVVLGTGGGWKRAG